MADSEADLRPQLTAELERLALRWEDLPGGGFMVGSGGLQAFIAHLQKFEPGVTWRQVLPDLPSHWEVAKPETWTAPYRPLGPFDYQQLPTGPVIHVAWHKDGPERLEELVGQGRAAGWRIYGAGVLPAPPNSEYHALVVLERGTSEDDLLRFGAWLDKHPDFAVAGFVRLGTEKYLDS
jgi:hypothetical protein